MSKNDKEEGAFGKVIQEDEEEEEEEVEEQSESE